MRGGLPAQVSTLLEILVDLPYHDKRVSVMRVVSTLLEILEL